MKAIKHWWFTGGTGCTGIVLAENNDGERHLYIGTVHGYDEQADIQTLLDWGSKIPASILAELLTL